MAGNWILYYTFHLFWWSWQQITEKPTQKGRYEGKQVTSFSSHHRNNREVESRRVLKQWLSYGIKFQHSVYIFDLLLRCGVCFQVESFKMTFLPYFKASYPGTILSSRREGVDSPYPLFFFFSVRKYFVKFSSAKYP